MKIINNRTREYRSVAAEGSRWTVLCDGEDSRLWTSVKYVSPELQAAPQSVLILGRLAEETEGETGDMTDMTLDVAADMEEDDTTGTETWEKQAV